jgi:hypothetical protein
MPFVVDRAEDGKTFLAVFGRCSGTAAVRSVRSLLSFDVVRRSFAVLQQRPGTAI